MTGENDGTRWVRSAGVWADESIEPFSYGYIMHFVYEEDWHKDVAIDPTRIYGTNHGRYNKGMTWRSFLQHGQHIATTLRNLATHPEYYDDPIQLDFDRRGEPQWELFEIEGDYFVSEGNHRSVIAKFRAMEDGVTSQRIPQVKSLKIDQEAHEADTILQSMTRGDQFCRPKREQKTAFGEYPARYLCGFQVEGCGVDPRQIRTAAEAKSIVRHKNRWRYKLEEIAAKFRKNRVD